MYWLATSLLIAVSSSRNSFILHIMMLTMIIALMMTTMMILILMKTMMISMMMILYLMKGSLPFCVSMCHGFGRARRSETEP